MHITTEYSLLREPIYIYLRFYLSISISMAFLIYQHRAVFICFLQEPSSIIFTADLISILSTISSTSLMKILKSMGPGMAPSGVCNSILNIFNMSGGNRFVFPLFFCYTLQ